MCCSIDSSDLELESPERQTERHEQKEDISWRSNYVMRCLGLKRPQIIQQITEVIDNANFKPKKRVAFVSEFTLFVND